MRLRNLALITALASFAVFGSGTATAAAAPIWNLDIHHNETNFPPGGTALYWMDMSNVGDADTSGPVTLTIQLPAGLTRNAVIDFQENNHPGGGWSCPGSSGDTMIVCTLSTPFKHHSRDFFHVFLRVDVAPGASGDLLTTASISGGGAAATATASELTHISPEPASFGIVPGSFYADFLGSDGLTLVRQASAHPYSARFDFDLNSIAAATPGLPDRKTPSGSLRDLRLDLPEGFIGNPTAVGECEPSELLTNTCPRSSQVGIANVILFPAVDQLAFGADAPIFNMSHPKGVITDLAFQITQNPVHIKASLDPEHNYAIRTTVSDINETLAPYTSSVTIWGIPGDLSHDAERAGCGADPSCSTGAPAKAFLTVPARCDAAASMTLSHYDSWQDIGAFGPDVGYTLPGNFVNCDIPRFDPRVSIRPIGTQANTPTGLEVHIQVPQNANANALSTPPVKSAVVTLPQGMSFSPSFADGLQGCTLAQMKLGTNEPIECPDASRIGEVTLSTPLLPKPAEGSMYLAAQGDNPFGSLFAVYLVLHDTEERGALIKIPGRIDVDPVSGQITTTFDGTPQFPFEDLTLKFRSGPRAPLVSPPSCGKHAIGVKIASWAQPNDPVDVSNTYEVTEGPNGTACPPDSAHRPFHPAMSAGTLNPSAGSYSPFLFRLSREDSEQELSQVSAVLPPGLTAKIAGIAACSDAALASISTQEGTGAAELASPACPAASQIGSVSAGLGAGPGPNYFSGKVYLAGPYKGAPLSLAVVVPALAGPFDLGNTVVRAAVYVDRSTAQVTAVSDPFPTILHGVILRVRDVRLRMDRPETTLNPTNCQRMAVGAKVTGVGGDLSSTADDSLFPTSDPFQVGDCASLGFKPNLSLRLFGGTKRGAFPKLKATLRMPKGNANVGAASVALPHSEFLAQQHIRTVCTRVQYAADQCPAASVYGTAVAKTPLFGQPLEGPVYLRSSSNPLPDMVAKLKGPASQPIQVDLVGRIDSVKGGIRNTFEVVPDAPVETFTLELQGGKKGLLVNSRNLCKSVNRATAKFSGQNGKVSLTHPPLQNSCAKARKGKGKGKAKRTSTERPLLELARSAF